MTGIFIKLHNVKSTHYCEYSLFLIHTFVLAILQKMLVVQYNTIEQLPAPP